MLCADIDRVADRAAWSPDPSAIPDGSGDPADPADLADRVREAVRSALTERQRAVVEGYFFEGLSQGDLARRLGVTQQVVQKALFGTVRGGKRIGGALGKLRAALSPLAPAA